MEFALVFIFLATLSTFLRASGFGLAESFYNADLSVQLIHLYQAQKEAVFSAFPYHLGYSGLAATYLRLPLSVLGEVVYGFRGWLAAQMVWSFVIWPASLGTLIYGFTRTRFSRGASIAAALWLSVGNTFLLKIWVNDNYLVTLCLGVALLWFLHHLILASLANLAHSKMSRAKLLGIGFLMGLGTYQSRMFLLFIAAGFAPLVFTWLQTKDFFKKLKVGSVELFFIFLFLYLEFFGSHLGTLAEKKLILHASPNLTLALLILALRNIKVISQTLLEFWIERLNPNLPKYGILLSGAGFTLGFLPELLYRAFELGPIGEIPQNQYSIPEMLQNLAEMPRIWRALFETLPTSALSALGYIVPIIGLVFAAKQKRSAIPWLLGLTLFASLRMRNYAGFNERYLIPLLPALAFGIAAGLDHLTRTRKIKKRALALSVVLFVLSCGVQGYGQWRYLHSPQHLETRVEITQIILALRAQNLDLLVSDDYWNTNQYTLFSQLQLKTLSTPTLGLTQPSALEAYKSAHAYALLTHSSTLPKLDPGLSATPIGRINSISLWKVVRKSESSN